MDNARGWFEKMNRGADFNRDPISCAMLHPCQWVIEFAGRCIGEARLTVDAKNRRARYAIGIFDTTKLGMGLGTEATRMVLRYAFEVLKLHRVDLRVLEYNRRAIRCYEKCGFVKEGVER